MKEECIGCAWKTPNGCSLPNCTPFKMYKEKVNYLPSMVLDEQGENIGYWLDRGQYYACSACGHSVEVEFDTNKKIKYKFCPICGAKMEGI